MKNFLWTLMIKEIKNVFVANNFVHIEFEDEIFEILESKEKVKINKVFVI